MRRFFLAIVALTISSCSLFEPEAGPLEGKIDGAAATGGGGYGSTDGALVNGKDPRCQPDAGFVDNICDLCENDGCCATRFGCYDDPSCASSNMAFDGCLAVAKEAATPDPAAITKCWADLSGTGSVAKARVDCQRAKCKTQCEVP